jgi:hypothetical protein
MRERFHIELGTSRPPKRKKKKKEKKVDKGSAFEALGTNLLFSSHPLHI